MVTGNLEQRIGDLEKANSLIKEEIGKLQATNETLQREVERAKAVGEIQSVMSRYIFYHSVLDGDNEAELFAHHTPGTRIAMGYGIYEGYAGVKRFFSLEKKGTLPAGHMVHHILSTPIIIVAGDGKTAKGAWICPGEETRIGPDGKPNSMFFWMKYGCDFVKEDGQWRIWHLNVYSLFSTSFEIMLMKPPEGGKMEMPKPPNWEEVMPDRPPIENKWMYSPTAVYPDNEPWPPVPYETWDEAMSYVP
jgi:hypothetical protein